MNTNMIRLKRGVKALLWLMLAGVSCSCDGDFLKEYSQDLSRVKTVNDLEEVLVGDCYLPLSLVDDSWGYVRYINYNYTILNVMADELEENLQTVYDDPGTSTRQHFFPYFCWQKDCNLDYEGKNTLEEDESEPWNLSYRLINNCNMVLFQADEIKTSTDEEQELLTKIRGEAHFLRAVYYSMLVNLYARPYAPATAQATPGVPVKTSEKIEDVEFQRASVADVYRLIVDDLNEAESLLKNVAAPASIYHAGINAVYLFHSRMCLYMQDWEGARHYAQMSLEQKSELCNLSAVSTDSYPVSESNPEVFYSNGAACFGNVCFTSPGHVNSWGEWSEPTYVVSEHLSGLFGEGDLRLERYITSGDDHENRQYTYHKIDNSAESYNVYKKVSDVLCFRSAEAYLNLAEANAQLGNDGEACSNLGTLRRARVEGNSEVSLTGGALVAFIREERERELCFEGHRWFDLRRYMVDAKYPFSKTIEHSFATYTNYALSSAMFYRLEPNDDAYTLNIPKSVRDFQHSIGANERPVRPVVRTASF